MSSKAKRARRIKLGIPNTDGDCNSLRLCFVGHKANDRIKPAMLAIIHLLCERSKGTAHRHKDQLFPVGYILWEVGLFKPGVPPKLRELWAAINDAVESAFVRGKEDGASIIKRLASGDATVREFNEETIKANGEKL